MRLADYHWAVHVHRGLQHLRASAFDGSKKSTCLLASSVASQRRQFSMFAHEVPHDSPFTKLGVQHKVNQLTVHAMHKGRCYSCCPRQRRAHVCLFMKRYAFIVAFCDLL